jgi:predicted nucleic acid-binding protein
MVAHGLIDTGAILALLDQGDPWHQPCREALAAVRFPLATSTAVLAELFHLLGHNRRDVAAGWTFLRSGAVTIAPITDADMAQLDGLMARYYDRPMDFADATLVHVAKRESLITILTIDHDDFETYRIGRRQRFQILPERRLFQ